ncbi:unnamed protein product [Closterium sp. NIES-64]|nr:unnamed protein product [Closterium sp. NIES-64]
MTVCTIVAAKTILVGGPYTSSPFVSCLSLLPLSLARVSSSRPHSCARRQAKKIQVGGPYRLSPWGPLTIKWKCPPIETGDKLVFKWTQRSDIRLFVTQYTDPTTFTQPKNWAQCKTSKATTLKKASKSGSFTYTVSADDHFNLMFASGVGNMCKRGQRFMSPIPKCTTSSGCIGV